MKGEEVAHLNHALFGGAFVRGVGNRVEADQVDAYAAQGGEQTHEFLAVAGRIVESAEYDILEGETALVVPVVFGEHAEQFLHAVGVLRRHHLQTLLGERVVQRDGQMTGALCDELFHGPSDADGGHRDAAGAPAERVGCHQELGGAQDILEVVHRLALTHEDDVGQALPFGQSVNLVEDVGGAAVALEALTACHAESAAHAATHLRGHTQRAAIGFGDEDGLDTLAAGCGEEILHRAVHALQTLRVGHLADDVLPGKQRAVLLREVGHGLNAVHVLLIDPLRQLLGGEAGHAQRCHRLLHFL